MWVFEHTHSSGDRMAKSPVHFLTEVRDELKKVTYPSREEVIRLTTIVIILSVAVALFLSGLDYIFARLFNKLLSF